MLSSYCNQSITLKTKASINVYNEATYTTSTIRCRFEYKRKLVVNKKGEQVISEARVFTKTAVNVDDVITYDSKDWNVVAVANMVDISGNVVGYEVSL
jgi:hypothetical protein